MTDDRPDPSEKSRGIALALSILLGPFGAHRFYVGKTGTGAAMLCTLGGLGLWWLYDVIVITGGEFRDVEGRALTHWEPQVEGALERRLPGEVLDELHALRAEVAELSERVDFTERLLARPRDESSDSPETRGR